MPNLDTFVGIPVYDGNRRQIGVVTDAKIDDDGIAVDITIKRDRWAGPRNTPQPSARKQRRRQQRESRRRNRAR